MISAWISGVSVGVVIMSCIWMTFTTRSIRRDRRAMQIMNDHMKEMFDDITAAQLRRSGPEKQ